MTVEKFSCVIMGEESLLVQCAEILRSRGHSIRAVVTDREPIESWARGAELPVVPPGKDLAQRLSSADGFDYLLSITNLRILKDDVLALPRRSAINFHDGPLPDYAGLYTPVWALIRGEGEYGVTLHEIAPGIDTGDILVQKRFSVADDETSLTLNTKCYAAGIEAFGELVGALESGKLGRVAQDASRRTYFGKFDRPPAGCTLDLSKDATSQAALIRALDFGRYENPVGRAKLAHDGRVIAVGGVEELDEDASAVPPGTLLRVEPGGLVVAMAEGVLRLSQLSTLEGVELSAAQAAEHLGARAGGVLQGPGPELRARLTELNVELARAEAGWVGRLAALDGVEIPYLRTERVGTGEARLGRRSVAVPAAFRDAFSGLKTADAVLAAVGAHLARLSNHRCFDVALRTPELRAMRAGLEGFLAGEVPLRIDLADAALSGRAGVERVVQALDARRKAGTFMRDLVSRFPSVRDNAELRAGRLLPVCFAIEQDASSFVPAAGTLFAACTDGATVELIFDERALAAEDADAMARQLGALLAGLAAQPDGELASLSLLTSAERQQLLRDWNATETSLPRELTIHQQFEAQVARTPDAPAVSCEGQQHTYAELNRRANQLAAHLRGLGVGPDQMVGVFVDRSLDLIVSILGVAKAGGAYLPLDPDYPRDRIAFMLEDSGAQVVITRAALAEELPAQGVTVVSIDRGWDAIAARPDGNLPSVAGPENLAYVIYTSGSTGRPKGVMVEHRNVVNFFVGMDDRVPHDPPGVWLAVTSLSFDISVLELLWTLCRGFKVVVYVDRERGTGSAAARQAYRPIDFGIFLWGNDDGPGPTKYRLMLESARFGDTHGFSSISTPERHFHAFGGPYPNPSVSGAAIAAVTERIQIRAGSCVVPLHHPIRVAEEWGLVDNLSNGRVGIAFASGWQPNDFVLQPGNYKDAKKRTFESMELVRRLWRGEKVAFENPLGESIEITSLPRPVQKELPYWVTTAGNEETYRMAGAAGANVLTHLLGQSLEEVAGKVQVYRAARAAAGLDPREGKVTLMLHTFVGEDDDEVRELVRQPMKDYLASSVSLVKNFAWAFPAFKRPPSGRIEDIDLGGLAQDELDAILDHAFERYFETSGLFGTAETCAQMVERVKQADIDEITCLIDYGVPTDAVLASLPLLDRVRSAANTPPADAGRTSYSLAAEVERHGVTHMQCTPSMAKMMTIHEEMRAALGKVEHLMVGGEAFPVQLAAELHDCRRGGTITNMYGPTETTIWSSTEPVRGKPDNISIGRPIANTQLYVVDQNLEPLPVGVAGELLIGGHGVVRGYHRRPELTKERFVSDPFRGGDARLYRTGDLARFMADGRIDFLGRMDFQVKIRGYRIELGEIETQLGRLPGVRQAVVIAREDNPGDKRLVAYLTADGAAPPVDALRDGLRENLPEFMVPSAFAFLDKLPLTPNGKIDRKALPAPETLREKAGGQGPAPEGDLERTIAEIWKRVLGVEAVGRDENFFDLGGHSLLVVQAHRALREKLERPLSLTDLYRFPTVAGLASYLGGSGQDEGIKRAKDRAAKRRELMRRRRH